MVIKTKKQRGTKGKGRYYKFGSYTTRKEALHAASVLRKHNNKAYTKKNSKGGWDVMYA